MHGTPLRPRVPHTAGAGPAPRPLRSTLAVNDEHPRLIDLSVYDAAYLDLARFRNAPLATLDETLRQAAAKAGVVLAD